MKTDTEELKRLAEAATPGPWEYTHAGRGDNGMFLITEYFVFIDGDDTAIAACILDPKTCRPSKGNAAYIAAANPAAVLELIADVERLRKANDRAQAEIEQLNLTIATLTKEGRDASEM